jgi:hypothetical protein
MIVKELYKIRNDGLKLYRTYSDKDYKIKQVETGCIFDEAIDLETSNYTYVETDIKIEETEDLEVLDNVDIEN